MDTLDDDDRIIDHNRNRQHHCRQGQQVQAETDQFQDEERTDQSNRDGNSRNQGRTHILQEDIYHDKYQDKCLDQGLDNFVDRSKQEVVGTLGDVDTQAFRQGLFCVGQYFFQVRNGLGRVGSCHLIYDTRYGFMTVYRIVEAIS